MSEPVILAIIALLGAGGGITTIVKAILDHRANVSAREQDADNRLVTRLEARLTDTENRLSRVEADLEDERAFNALLIGALARAGITIPPRPPRTN